MKSANENKQLHPSSPLKRHFTALERQSLIAAYEMSPNIQANDCAPSPPSPARTPRHNPGHPPLLSDKSVTTHFETVRFNDSVRPRLSSQDCRDWKILTLRQLKQGGRRGLQIRDQSKKGRSRSKKGIEVSISKNRSGSPWGTRGRGGESKGEAPRRKYQCLGRLSEGRVLGRFQWSIQVEKREPDYFC